MDYVNSMIHLLFIALTAWSAANHSQCLSTELEALNCDLKKGSYQVLLNQQNMIVFDGVHRQVSPMPIQDPGIVWEKVRLEKVGRRWFLSLQVWSPPEGEAFVQNLMWYVVELEGEKPNLRLTEIVQRRRSSETKSSDKKATYLFDPKKKTGLKGLRDGKVRAQIGKNFKDI